MVATLTVLDSGGGTCTANESGTAVILEVAPGAVITALSSPNNTLVTGLTSGTATADINYSEAGVWTANQSFPAAGVLIKGSSTGYTALASANTSVTAYTATLPANTGQVAETNLAQSWTAMQTFGTNASFFGVPLSGTAGSSGDVMTYNGTNLIMSASGASGVTSMAAGTGISVSAATGAVTVTNTGVDSLVAGTGISVSAATGAVTISATGGASGVSQIVPGQNVVLSPTGGTGAVTVNANPNQEVSVSPVGTAAGYTTNNGAMYGPDTATTLTSGIREAVAYAFANNMKVKLRPGRFVISATAPFVFLSTAVAPISIGTTAYNYDIYALIPLPVPAAGPPFIHRIEGAGGVYGVGGADGQFVAGTGNWGLSIIDCSGVTTAMPAAGSGSAGVWCFAIGAATPNPPSATGALCGVEASDFAVFTTNYNANPTIGAICNFSGWDSCVERITCIPASGNGSTVGQFPVAAPTYPFAPGFMVDGGWGDENWMTECYAQNLPVGFMLGDHLSAGNLCTQACYYGAVTYTTPEGNYIHVPTIQRFDCQQNVYNVGVNTTDAVHIGWMDGEDRLNTSTTADFNFGLGGVMATNGLDYYAYVDVFRMLTYGATPIFRFPKLAFNGNSPGVHIGKVHLAEYVVVPTLPANPPVSGTSYQNTIGLDLILSIPITYTSTGTATFNVGPSSAANTIYHKAVTVAGTDTAIVRVPAGFYYSLTVAAATIGTTVVSVP